KIETKPQVVTLSRYIFPYSFTKSVMAGLCPKTIRLSKRSSHFLISISSCFSSNVYKESLKTMSSSGHLRFCAKILAVSEALLAVLDQKTNEFGRCECIFSDIK